MISKIKCTNVPINGRQPNARPECASGNGNQSEVKEITDGAILSSQAAERNGGDDGTRTRGLCRDRERLTSTFNHFESTDGNRSHCKYAVSSLIVYHVVYHESEQWNQGFNKASE